MLNIVSPPVATAAILTRTQAHTLLRLNRWPHPSGQGLHAPRFVLFFFFLSFIFGKYWGLQYFWHCSVLHAGRVVPCCLTMSVLWVCVVYRTGLPHHVPRVLFEMEHKLTRKRMIRDQNLKRWTKTRKPDLVNIQIGSLVVPFLLEKFREFLGWEKIPIRAFLEN